MEAIQKDFAERNVKFYYVYKSLAHPEKGGLVQPETLEERLLHISKADSDLETDIDWLADSMTNELKHAFGDRNNSEFVIAPDGTVVSAKEWCDPVQLRSNLEKWVGKPETTTLAKSSRTQLTTTSKIKTGIVPRIERSSDNSVTLKVDVESLSEKPLYLKLRPEIDRSALQSGGKTQLYLGFFMDPIHRVHWNNLAPPMKFEISGADGVTFAQSSCESQKVTKADADMDPREFLVEVDIPESALGEPLIVKTSYFACDDDDQFCVQVSQNFTIHLDQDPDAGRVSGKRPGSMNRGKSKGKGTPTVARVFSKFDQDQNGKLTKDELEGRSMVMQRFSTWDSDKDGTLSKEEVSTGLQSMSR
ncbi:MAG: EF-hand domain-containing protein [Verrucomicrobiota bacterium]